MSISVTCDHCKRILSTDSHPTDSYYLKLSSIHQPPNTDFTEDVFIISPLDGENKHFCGLGCLKKWINEI